LGLWEILNNGFTLLLYTATFNHFENTCFDTCGLAIGSHVSVHLMLIPSLQQQNTHLHRLH